MEISRLIFTKETKEEIEKGLNATQRGVLRWNKLKEAEKAGTLALAKNRNEVANIAGFTEINKTRGYQWVTNMISRGNLKETIQGFSKNRKMEYEYHIVKDPDYTRHKSRNAAKAAKQRQAKKMQKETKATVSITAPMNSNTYKLEILHNETTIKLELNEYEKVVELIKTILKGE